MDETVIVRLHHKGRFTKNKYIGGSYDTFEEDPYRFSYSVLMEFVKEMKYKEIGGIFVNNDGWKLVSDDQTLRQFTQEKTELDFYIECTVNKAIPAVKQVQPHVVVRPRSSPVITKEKMAEKRTFVTLQNINAEKKRKLKDRNDDKERRISTRKKLQFNDDVSTHEEELIGLADYIKRFESPDTKAEKAGEGLPDPKAKIVGAGLPDIKAKKSSEELRDTKTKEAGAGLPDPKAKTVGEELGKCVEGQGCNDYEMKRNDNVAKNKAKLKELGLVPSKSAKSCQKDKGKCKETNEDASESEYVPDNNDVEAEQQSDREDDNVTSKVCFYLIYALT